MKNKPPGKPVVSKMLDVLKPACCFSLIFSTLWILFIFYWNRLGCLRSVGIGQENCWYNGIGSTGSVIVSSSGVETVAPVSLLLLAGVLQLTLLLC